ncbi:MAG: hypothetical protein JNK05_02190 [Myxococcales bacterium]|nr:hypothetical protein [Myxococcales bacterium]
MAAIAGACGSSVAPTPAPVCGSGNLPPLDRTPTPAPPRSCTLAFYPDSTGIVVRDRAGEIVRDARFVVRDFEGNECRCPDEHGVLCCSSSHEGRHFVSLAASELRVEVFAPVRVAPTVFCAEYERDEPNGIGCDAVRYRTTRPIEITAGSPR